MRPALSQARIDLIIHNGDGEWWQIVAALSPIIVLFAAVLVTVILWLRRRWRTGTTRPGRRSDWWQRARWALEASLDDDPKRREVGLAALELLNASNLSGKEESLIIAEAWKVPLCGRESMSTSVEKKPIDCGGQPRKISPEEERVVVRAARLRLSSDRKQGIESPSWVKEIAKRPL